MFAVALHPQLERNPSHPHVESLPERHAGIKREENAYGLATEQRVLPRDRPQFVISCLEKIAQ